MIPIMDILRSLDGNIWRLVAIPLCVFIYFLPSMTSTSNVWSKRAKAVIKKRDSKVHKVLSQQTVKNNNFDVYSSASKIQMLIRSGVLSREAYITSLINRTRTIGLHLLNAVTEEMYDDAVESARLVDKSDKVTGGEGDLFGLPLSIKDSVAVKGTDATCGIAARCMSPYPNDGLAVSTLRKIGMIPFVKTNVPQLLMMPETENSVFGVTLNPWDLKRTPGGSSGGEAALIASACSVIGVGTDIGGSIRIPAHFSGIVGFKPTPQRMTKTGNVVPRLGGRSGQVIIQSTVGPMARSVADCVSMMRVLCSPAVQQQDCTVPPVGVWDDVMCLSGTSASEAESWQGQGNDLHEDSGKKGGNKKKSKPASLPSSPKCTPGRKLKIAYLVSDDWFEPTAACKRAVMIAVDKLRAQGHTLVPFVHPASASFHKVVTTYIALLSADGNWYSFLRALEGEPLYKTYKTLQFYTEIPNFVRPLLMAFLRFAGENRKADLMSTQKSGGLSVREYWERIADKAEVETAYKEMFATEGYDALILPPVGLPATPHGLIADLLLSLSYSFLANLLHWPAGVVPVTLVEESEQHYRPADLPANQRDSIAALANTAMIDSAGLPVGVQVMTAMWQDELCMYVMSEIERGVKFSHRPNLPTAAN